MSDVTQQEMIHRLLAEGNFSGLEDLWLGWLSQEVESLEAFFETLDALELRDAVERARPWIELLDEHLCDSGRWDLRLELLRRAGALVAGEALHERILTTLEHLYADRPSRAAFVEWVGLGRAVDDIPKTWTKVDRLRRLMERDVGTIVWIEGQGAGRVVDAIFELESFKVELEEHRGLTVGFKAAPRLLMPLPPGHILRQKLEHPAELRALAEEDPGELLRRVLTSYDGPVTAGRIREILDGIVPSERWTKWWAAARRHPQVVSTRSGRQTYAWAASGAAADEEVWERFSSADLPEQLQLFRREFPRRPALRERLAGALEAAGRELAAESPAGALAVWIALERQGVRPRHESFAPGRLLVEGDPAALLEATSDRELRARLYDLVRELRDDWVDLFRERLAAESDLRLFDELVTRLLEQDPEAVEGFLDGALARPRTHPTAFVWLVERVAKQADLGRRSPLRLLQQLLDTLSRAEFAPYRARLRPQFASGGVLARCLAALDATEAPAAEQAIRRSPLDGSEKQPLLTALELRFPALRQAEEEPLYATMVSIQRKREELRRLKEEEIPANRRAIETAREMGDLRENFEYKAARQRHEYLSALVASRQRELERARPLDASRLDTSTVHIGARVELDGPDGRRTLTLLGPWESDPENGVISYESDLGKRLLGKRVGDPVPLEGREYRIAAITAWRP